MGTDIDTECINNIRILGAELPLAANSGHPGAPMGCAPIAHALFGYCMNFCSAAPEWINRDRFVLSNGHACALLYTMLHLCGYDITIEDLKQFRRAHSKTPGHPESFITPGVEVCTGPLGQGVSNAVGMAIMSRHFECTYNKEGYELFNNYTIVLCGDGCLQEGVSSETASLAGHLQLKRLIVLYDSNNITIDGECHLSFSENVHDRYKAYGWNVLEIKDGDNSHKNVLDTINKAKQSSESKPTLIIVKTTIGYGSAKQGTEKVHGAPLTADDVKAVKKKFNFNENESFEIKQATRDFYLKRKQQLNEKYVAWCEMFSKYQKEYPELAAELERRFRGDLKSTEDILPLLNGATTKPNGTRAYGRECLNNAFHNYPEIIGGSADLKESNRVDVDGTGSQDFMANDVAKARNRYIRFGVREHGMFAISNGMFAFGGTRPFVSTFLNFITYGWGSVRLSALSRFGIGYIMTHDSVELGEDGPTHQPIETMGLLRSTPNLIDFRPSDCNECVAAYTVWLKNKYSPTVICLSRSATNPSINGTCAKKAQLGAYILKDFANLDDKVPKVIVASSGSELDLVVKSVEQAFGKEGFMVNVRVVSFPSWRLFEQQSEEYRNKILPKDIKKLLVEPYFEYGYEKFFDYMIGLTSFGLSAAKSEVWKEFGYTNENITKQIVNIANGKGVDYIVRKDKHVRDHPFLNSIVNQEAIKKAKGGL